LSQTIAQVISNYKISDDIYRARFKCPEVATNAKPGQFVSILCSDLILRRPFSIAKAQDDWFEVIYKIKGKGTTIISNFKNEDEVDLIGPLGKGFNLTSQKALLLGAGVGSAPVIFISQYLKMQKTPYVMLNGFRNKVEIPELEEESSYIVTEDASTPYKGSVNDYVEKMIVEHNIEKIYTCGPSVVMKHAVEMARKYDIEIETAMEREFACGIGVCMGCNIKIYQDNKLINKRICKDGPVFNGKDVVW